MCPRLPAPGPLGAIVHPIAASTCDLDCPLALGATQLALPLHLGHECVAEVIAVGERVGTVRVGDRVVVPFQINCGACEPCRDGRTGSCTGVPPISMYGMGVTAGHWGGAFSDQLAVPYADAMLVPLPDGIDPIAAASVADNVCDAHRHIAPHLPALLRKDPSAEVLILAATDRKTLFTASLPLYTGLIARAYGARNVTLADARPRIREHAERLGFDACTRASCAGAAPRRWSRTSTPTRASRSPARLRTASARAREDCTAAPASRCCGCMSATPPSMSGARMRAH